ncbi:hypothetical protein [Fibrobacter sp. UWT3]|uniref:hypothetical protein n=1 Tax=Fibrobacter sp. UWT3 TaxID=1896225 RepID=UPI00114252AB|nr:hypothetical protein [Fibrobacter sp. UWT3]
MANNEVTLRIGADATGLQNGLRQSSTAVSSFGTKARATIARVGGSMRGLADRLVTPFNSLVLGGGLGMAVKNVGDLPNRSCITVCGKEKRRGHEVVPRIAA